MESVQLNCMIWILNQPSFLRILPNVLAWKIPHRVRGRHSTWFRRHHTLKDYLPVLVYGWQEVDLVLLGSLCKLKFVHRFVLLEVVFVTLRMILMMMKWWIIWRSMIPQRMILLKQLKSKLVHHLVTQMK